MTADSRLEGVEEMSRGRVPPVSSRESRRHDDAEMAFDARAFLAG